MSRDDIRSLKNSFQTTEMSLGLMVTTKRNEVRIVDYSVKRTLKDLNPVGRPNDTGIRFEHTDKKYN